MGLVVERGISLEVKGCTDYFKRSSVSAEQGDCVAAEGIIGDENIRHLDRIAAIGVLRKGCDGIGKLHHRWGLVEIADREVVAGADRAGAHDSDVAHRNHYGVGVFGLEIEGGISLEEKGSAHDLKGRRIVSTNGDCVAAEGVIADDDIGHLDRTAGGGVFRQGCDGVSKRHLCGCRVRSADREVVGGGDGTGTGDRGVQN